MSEQIPQLNDGQQAAVDHTTGPLLVVAGAGTGKTRVIVEKINKSLDEGANPASILAVTFTEKAAAEMLERVLASRSQLLPDLPVMTFNGFGDLLLREYGAHIGLPRNFRLLSEQAQVVFFRERIDQFQLDYFLPLTSSPDGIIADILQLFSRLKQNIITPETYQTFAKKLPDGDEMVALDKRMHQELADAYDTYTSLCRQENVIDYDDQIYLCIQLLEQRPNVQRELQQQYQTLLIDEFQDTNVMQSRLIDLLYSKESVNDVRTRAGETVSVQQRSAERAVLKYGELSTGADKPKLSAKTAGSAALQQTSPAGARVLMVVGDDDQSIYGWRGATLQNILSFKDRYPDAAETALTVNYRSHQAILDAAYRLIQHNNPDRLEASLGINKRLTSDCPGAAPVVKRFADTAAELEWLATDIARRVNKLDENEPVSIAVLARSNNTAAAVHGALSANDVPHRVIGATQDLYTRPVVRMLIELIRTVSEPHNNTSLHHTLVSELFGIGNDAIAPLAARASHEHELLETLLSDIPKAAQALALIKTWREQAASYSVGRLLWRAMSETGYKDSLLKRAAQDDQAAASVQHVTQFFDSLRQFENIAIQPTAVQYLASLPALQAAGETTDDGTLAINNHEVTVITVHKAKGLEWDTVYIPVLQEQAFPLKKRADGLQPPAELRSASVGAADEHYAEERRLMYVAATRARRNLIVSFADKGKTGTARKPSRFIDEMFGSGTAETTPLIDVADPQQSLLDIPAETSPKISVPASIYDGTSVRLSVSQASALLDCPLNFYYKFVLKAPEEATPSTGYGSQLHRLFEAINKARRKDALAPLEEYLAELEGGWNKAGYVSKEQQQKAFRQAQQTLTNFYQRAASEPAPYLVEEPFEATLEPEHIILRGRMDVVYDHDGTEIRDYKTGNTIRDDAGAKKRATASSQLTMYALAWQLLHGDIPAKVSLEFVDSGYLGSVGKTQKGLDGLRSKLNKAADCIRTGDFSPGYRHDHCIHPPIGEL